MGGVLPSQAPGPPSLCGGPTSWGLFATDVQPAGMQGAWLTAESTTEPTHGLGPE